MGKIRFDEVVRNILSSQIGYVIEHIGRGELTVRVIVEISHLLT